jgi:class 3 adenylate cyclase/tetratricopeptide (TPR) repeat protein
MIQCARCGTANPETAKFCSECGAPLAVAPAREQRKVVTVLFCDVSGSTALGEGVDPEALREIMSRYFESARAAIERHGGTVEKFIGDAVMAVFGIPTVHEDDALRATRAALELRDAVEVDVRIGVNTGEVVTGGPEKLATGDAVNIAARLEQAAGTGEVLIGEQTYALVRHDVDAELLPPLDAKGKAEPLTAYRLRSISVSVSRRNAADMIGRARELELLQRAFERARDEHACHLFTILGPAGIGKSRLVSEFQSQLDGARVVGGRCISYGDGVTYWPVIEVLKRLDEPVEPVIHDGTTPPEIAWSVRKTLERIALDEPLVVVFDDIQWGEETFLDLIEHVADLSRGAPILLLCMARPELLDVRPGWGGGKLNATSVLLEPLPENETATLVRALLGVADDALVARIGDAADGNPLFAEEMVELALVSGGDVAVPPTIHALLAARIDGLPPDERALLELGAIEGQIFHREALVALAGGEADVDARLAALVRKELLRPEPSLVSDDDAYRFRHLLIRDAAYDGVPKSVRIDLHERFATWLEESGPRLIELDEIAGYHLEQASLYAGELGRDRFVLGKRAAIHLAAAAIRTDAWGDVGAAAKLGLRAERLVTRDDPRRLLLLPLLARTLDDCGRSDEALPLLDEAVEHGDVVTSARARAMRATIRAHAEGIGTERGVAEVTRALDDLAGVGDDDVLADVTLELAWLRFWEGRMSETAKLTAIAREHAERSGNRHVQVKAIGLHAGSLARGATPLPEIEAFVEEVSALESLGPALAANALFFQSRCLAERDEVATARALREEAIRRMEELGLTLLAPGTRQHAATYEWLVPDWDEMERNARISWDSLGALGERGIRAGAGALLAVALAELGRDAEAEALVEQVPGMTTDDYEVDFWLAVARGRLAAKAGDPVAAVECARQAVRSMDGTDEHFMRLMALVALAEAEVAAGDLAAAAATIDGVVVEAERRQSPAFLRRAQSVLTMTA